MRLTGIRALRAAQEMRRMSPVNAVKPEDVSLIGKASTADQNTLNKEVSGSQEKVFILGIDAPDATGTYIG